MQEAEIREHGLSVLRGLRESVATDLALVSSTGDDDGEGPGLKAALRIIDAYTEGYSQVLVLVKVAVA